MTPEQIKAHNKRCTRLRPKLEYRRQLITCILSGLIGLVGFATMLVVIFK